MADLLTQDDFPELEPNGMFGIGPDWRFNACVGTNGGPYSDGHYADGYFEAAEHLCSAMANDFTVVQSGIYPLIFLYRQGVELSLKQLIRNLAYMNRDDAEPQLNHSLTTNWETLRPLIELNAQYFTDEWRIKPEILDWVESVVMEFAQVDSSSFAFRYANARNGAPSIGDLTHINVARLHQYANPLSRWFVELIICTGQMIDEGYFDEYAEQ